MLRRIALMLGAKEYLLQCLEGIFYLERTQATKDVEFAGLYINDLGMNTKQLLENLFIISQSGVNVLIVGGGSRNCLAAFCEDYLRHGLGNKNIVVITFPVASKEDPWGLASLLAIEITRNRQIVIKDWRDKDCLGAFKFAVEGELPTITIPEGRPSMHFESIYDAIDIAKKIINETKKKEGK